MLAPSTHPSGMVSLGIALTQMPDLALGLVEPREVCMGPPPKLHFIGVLTIDKNSAS